MSDNKKLTGTLIPKDNKKAKMHATFYSDKPIGGGGDSEIFDEYIDATDQQRNTALANVSNQTANSTTGKMGYKVLDPTKTFAEQVTAENTIYEIRDVFDLGGTQETPVSVTLPANSVLKFNGGSVKNCEITFDNTFIEGNANFGNTTINSNSTFANEWVDATWFGVSTDNADNGNIMNTLSLSTLPLMLPVGTYDVSTAITLSNNKILFLGDIRYVGQNGIDFNVLTLYGLSSAIVDIRGNILSKDYATATVSGNVAAVNIDSCNNSRFYFAKISSFNVGVKLTNTETQGCSYNSFYINFIQVSNRCIVLDNSVGWVNENTFYGGRFTVRYAEDNMVYANGRDDTTIGSVSFIKCSFETSNATPVYLKNCVGFTFYDCRFEYSTTKIKFVDNCVNTLVEQASYDVIAKSDWSENKGYPFLISNGHELFELIDFNSKRDMFIDSNNKAFYNKVGIRKTYGGATYNEVILSTPQDAPDYDSTEDVFDFHYLSTRIETKGCRVFMICFDNLSSSKSIAIHWQYTKDENGNDFIETTDSKLGDSYISASTLDYSLFYKLNFDIRYRVRIFNSPSRQAYVITLPDDVSEAVLSFSGKFRGFKLYAIKHYISTGQFALPIVHNTMTANDVTITSQYGQPIFYNGTKFVKADGTDA